MPRFASPALSENELDISNALFGGQDVSAEQEDDQSFGKSASKPGKNETLDFLDLSEEDDGDAGFIARKQAGANRRAAADKSGKKSTGFQTMGLDPPLMKAILRKGFSVPTPIQRKAIPLILDRKDVVGMARTGSGKTAAFVIPMIQRLKGHVAKVGARAAIMSPSRELALQTLKVVKEFGKGTDLRTVLLVGGDSLEEQFASMTSNPDIIIATPGRFLHLKVEMGLDLSSIQYMVFDEADRLFELGFATQLGEILHGLPASRQTLLFSATLPKSLVEFARAGLEEPKLVRLDAESKISPDLENAFFTVKSAEKEGALLHLVQDVIKIPLRSETSNGANGASNPKKRKRPQPTTSTSEAPTEHSTIVFCSTKHHVEYLANLLQSSGYAVSYVYGSLDQVARNSQIDAFRAGTSNILVVTDVAARGIDIPVLANVINYDFPSQAKIFVHRVGRTARAGRKGWSYSLIRDSDVPYMLDLQLFLGRRLILGRAEDDNLSFAEDFVVGALARDKVESCVEWVNKLLEDSPDLDALRDVAGKGEKQWMRSRNSASTESAKRAKTVLADKRVMELNQLFSDDVNKTQMARDDMLARISGFRPHETIFEIGKRGTGNAEADIMRTVRGRLEPKRRKAQAIDETEGARPRSQTIEEEAEDSDAFGNDEEVANMSDASEDELEVTFSTNNKTKNGNGSTNTWQDSEHFISYTPRESNMAEERGYGVHSGADSNNARSFIAQAADVAMDLTNDESKSFGEATRAKGMRWDKKGKKYVSRANDEDGSKGTKYVRGESGQKIAATYKSGRFDAWKKAQRITRMPRVGESETRLPNVGRGGGVTGGRGGGARYRHQSERAPKAADRFRDDYHVQKKRFDEAKEKRVGAFKNGGGKNEVRGVEGVRKERKLKERRKEKNARPVKRRKT